MLNLQQIELRSRGNRQWFYWPKDKKPPSPWRREFGSGFKTFEFMGVVEDVLIYEEITW